MRSHRRWAAPPLRVIAHRGGAREAPENTLHAFRRAVRLGADGVELDVRRSADGTLVVFHDETVDRTTDGAGRVVDLDIDDLRTLDAAFQFVPSRGAGSPRSAHGAAASARYPLRGVGIGIPTLAEALAATGDTGLVIEIKEPDAGVAADVAALVDAANGRDRVLCASFHDEPLAEFRRLGFTTSASQSELVHAWQVAHEDAATGRPPAIAAQVLQVPLSFRGIHVVTPPLVEAVRTAGLPLHVWTVDDAADVERLRTLGVDGIITDRPGRFLLPGPHDPPGRGRAPG